MSRCKDDEKALDCRVEELRKFRKSTDQILDTFLKMEAVLDYLSSLAKEAHENELFDRAKSLKMCHKIIKDYFNEKEGEDTK